MFHRWSWQVNGPMLPEPWMPLLKVCKKTTFEEADCCSVLRLGTGIAGHDNGDVIVCTGVNYILLLRCILGGRVRLWMNCQISMRTQVVTLQFSVTPRRPLDLCVVWASRDPVKQRIVEAMRIQLSHLLGMLCTSFLFAFFTDELLSFMPCWQSAADVALVYIKPILLWLIHCHCCCGCHDVIVALVCSGCHVPDVAFVECFILSLSQAVIVFAAADMMLMFCWQCTAAGLRFFASLGFETSFRGGWSADLMLLETQ